jgi:hypothetical protein
VSAVRISSFCSDRGCVGVTITSRDVQVVDTKTPLGPTLRFTPTEWKAFLAGVRNGEFDLENQKGGGGEQQR